MILCRSMSKSIDDQDIGIFLKNFTFFASQHDELSGPSLFLYRTIRCVIFVKSSAKQTKTEKIN